MTTYRIWPSTNGPGTATAFGGNFISGTGFFVTGEAWFQGYWWWVCASGGQSTSATKCALWQVDNGGGPHLIPGSVVTSGTLVQGWNYIPLPASLPLSYGGSPGASPQSAVTGVEGPCIYMAAIAVNGPFPDTNNYWGAAQPGAAGITNGPLTAYSAGSGSLPSPCSSGTPQGAFTTGGSDPSVTCPQGASGTDNFWVDVQVTSYASAGASGKSLRLWPNFPLPTGGPNNDNTLAMSGTAFSLSQSCTLNKIWMQNPPGSTGFASRVGIWNTDTQTEVSGTDNASPSWLNSSGGAASHGDSWIYVDYSGAGVTLPAGNYTVAYFNGNGLKIYTDSHNYFFSGTNPVGGGAVGGPGWNGLSYGGGILTAPNVANGPLLVYDDSSGTKPGQTPYQPGNVSWQYPSEFEASGDWGESRWADVEVTPIVPAPSIPLYTAFMSSM